MVSIALPQVGLSPLARGNHLEPVVFYLGLGPIPARAGEPLKKRSRSSGMGAYPRSRGGTSIHCSTQNEYQGLSPLARGNQTTAL